MRGSRPGAEADGPQVTGTSAQKAPPAHSEGHKPYPRSVIIGAASEGFQANRPQGDIALPATAAGFVSQDTSLLEFTYEAVIKRKQLTAASF